MSLSLVVGLLGYGLLHGRLRQGLYPHPGILTPMSAGILKTPMWYEMLNENTAGTPIEDMCMPGFLDTTESSDVDLQ